MSVFGYNLYICRYNLYIWYIIMSVYGTPYYRSVDMGVVQMLWRQYQQWRIWGHSSGGQRPSFPVKF